MSNACNFNVLAKLEPTETGICITGNIPSLGNWDVDKAVELVSNGDGTFSTTVSFESSTNCNNEPPKFRYFTKRDLLNSKNEAVSIISRWEAHALPRTAWQLNGISIPDIFGLQADEISTLEEGWLTRESEIRLTFSNKYAIELYIETYPITFLKIKAVDSRHLFCPVSKKMNSRSIVELHTDLTMAVVSSDVCCTFRSQDEFGWMYTIGDYLIYKTRTLIPSHSAFVFEIYGASSNDERPTLFAYGYLPLGFKTFESLKQDIFSVEDNVLCGNIKVDLLVIEPSSREFPCYFPISTSIRSWNKPHTLDIGHRGVGKSFSMNALVRENTIQSLHLAAELELDFVEFDVHLSKDLVPILYHDFYVSLKLSKKNEQNNDPDSIMHPVALKDLTLNELKDLQLYNRCNDEAVFLSNDTEMEMAFPTLEQAFMHVDEKLGFNVEIKFPMTLEDGKLECDTSVELNLYVDTILNVVLKFSESSRSVVFSSFVPAVCLMLKTKQNRYPVLFLTQGFSSRYQNYGDGLCNNAETGVRFAYSNGFVGIALPSEYLLRDLATIQMCKDRKLVWFVWGNDLVDDMFRQNMHKSGSYGIIRDNVKFAESYSKNVAERLRYETA